MGKAKLFKLILISFSAVIIFSVCSDKKNKGQNAAGSDASGKINIRINLKKGQTYKYDLTTDQEITQTVMKNEQKVDQKIGMVYRYDVSDISKDGDYHIKVTYDRVIFEQDGPAGNIKYDSSDPSKDVPMLAVGFSAISGQKFDMIMKPTAEITSISGVDKLIDNVLKVSLKKVSLSQTGQDGMIEKAIKRQFNENTIKEMVESMNYIYPKEPVGTGDSWKSNIKLSAMIPIKLDNKMTLMEIKDGLAMISVESKILTNKDAPPMDMGLAKVKYDLNGSQKGDVEVDIKTGWIIKSNVVQNMTGEIEVVGAGQSMTLPMEIKSDVSIRLVD